MSVEQIQTEDLKAFEQRLSECVQHLRPYAWRWRIVLFVVAVSTFVSAGYWLLDEQTSQVSFLKSLYNHPIFALSCFILIVLFLAGVHRRVVAPAILTSRCKTILADFNMSCDDTGKLILKPRNL
ncbi:nuclear envelope phosphatase-regulatory subunit 1-like [Apostichopus japonicus]|uniref:nuclear envelope phosphatase-regulatory subunit 1-like n=1 Tax=Stichopus japonicus TaxID=307972 RepID=UPI003AB47985